MKTNLPIKLLFVNENPLEKIKNEYYSVFSWVRFPQRLAESGVSVTLWAPVLHRDESSFPHIDSWHINTNNLNIEDLDPYDGYAAYFRLWPRRILSWRKEADRLIESHDAVIIRLPSPILPLISKCARRKKKPLILIVAGNFIKQSEHIIGSRGIKRLFYFSLVSLLVRQGVRHSKYADITYAHSEEIARKYHAKDGRVNLFLTPHVSRSDFKWRKNTCQRNEIRLLRVSWLSPSKGLDSLFNATALLIRKGYRLRLEIVGKEQSIGYEEILKNLAENLGITKHVSFTGWIPFNRINEVYFRSDVQIVSSLSEAFPRCIVEGASCGLPIVCTRTGGCPDRLHHGVNALLTPPGDASAMATAIERVILDDTLRRCLIREGYKMALGLSFEQLGMRLLEEVGEIIKERKDISV